jgi:hypothetical protein
MAWLPFGPSLRWKIRFFQDEIVGSVLPRWNSFKVTELPLGQFHRFFPITGTDVQFLLNGPTFPATIF